MSTLNQFMQGPLTKFLWYGYCLVLIGVGLTNIFGSPLWTVFCLALAVSIFYRLSWARYCAYLPLVLPILLFLIEAFHPAQGSLLFYLRGLLHKHIENNILLTYLLEKAGWAMWFWGFPRVVTKILICGGLAAVLGITHRSFWARSEKNAVNQKVAERGALKIGIAFSSLICVAGLFCWGYAIYKDPPPWGGSHPGGPSPGSIASVIIFITAPVVGLGALGFVPKLVFDDGHESAILDAV